MPRELGSRPRFLVDKADLSWRRVVEYPLLGRVRGRFSTGPLTVRTTDPFGLVQLDRQFVATSEVMVTPRVVPLPTIRATGGAGSTGEARPHRIGVVGQDDVLVREYRQGDDVRRIHWRSTARWGDLMVRREEQAWDPERQHPARLPGRRPRRPRHAELAGVGDLGGGLDRASTSWTTASASRSTRRTARCTSAAAWASTARRPQELVVSRLTDLRARPTTTHALRDRVGHRRPARPAGGRDHGPDDGRRTRTPCSGCAAIAPRAWRWCSTSTPSPTSPASERQRAQHELAVRILRDNQWRVVEVPPRDGSSSRGLDRPSSQIW